MACLSPIWIRNRRYSDPSTPHSKSFASDQFQSNLALAPYDVSRMRLLVPCGKCSECLRAKRNSWYIRLERELARCRHERRQAVFITITIDPKWYESAIQDPASFIRKWFERVRHITGRSIKHALFPEFGLHPEIGTEPRLHFHGFLFDFDMLYNELRDIVSDFGFIWLGKATLKRARYVVKYVTKNVSVDPSTLVGKFITLNNTKIPLQHAIYFPQFSRKYVSAHVGDYLGNRPAPSRRIHSWPTTDPRTGQRFDYSIPRYYDRYLSDEDKLYRSLSSAVLYAHFSSDSLVKRIVSKCIEIFAPDSALSFKQRPSRLRSAYLALSRGGEIPSIDLPALLTDDILTFWASNYSLTFT